MSNRDVTVLLCEAGGFEIGVDSSDVYAVMPDAGSELERTFARELFGRPVQPSRGARTLVLQSAQGVRIVVDRVLGLRNITPAEMRPLPASVRALGAADWVLGLAELEQRLVWLLDLARAARPASTGAT